MPAANSGRCLSVYGDYGTRYREKMLLSILCEADSTHFSQPFSNRKVSERHGREPSPGAKSAEFVSQNSSSFLISQKAVAPMSYELRRSRDLSNGSARIARPSGSAFRANVSVSTEHFKLLAGTPKRYVKTAESGNERLQAFCGNCGTPIYACAPAAPASYSLRIGTSNSAPPSRRASKSGGAPLCLGWTHWRPRQRRKKNWDGAPSGAIFP